MYYLLLVLVASFCYADAVPRWSWGSFANFEHLPQNNKTVESCTSGQCIQRIKCPEYATAASPYKICSNESNGPWVCCMGLNDVISEHSKYVNAQNTDQIDAHVLLKSSQSLNVSVADSPKTIAFFGSTERANIDGINELNSSTTSLSIPFEGRSEMHIHSNSSSVTHTANGDDVPRNFEFIIEAAQNETVSFDKDVYKVPEKSLTMINDAQNGTVMVAVDQKPVFDPLSNFPTNKSDKLVPSEIRYSPHSDRWGHANMDHDWVKEKGFLRNDDHNSNYYRRRTGKNTPRPRWKSTNDYLDNDYNLPSEKKSTKYSKERTTPRSWRKNHSPSSDRKSTTFGADSTTPRSWSKATKESHSRTTSGPWRKPSKEHWNRGSTSSFERKSSEDRTTTRSWRKPTTNSWNRDHTINLDRRSTKIRKTTTSRPWVNPTKQPSNTDYPLDFKNKVSRSRDYTTPSHSRNRPVPRNRDSTAPSWSISTGMWSGGRTPSVFTKKSIATSATKDILKSTATYPRWGTTTKRPLSTRSNNLSTKSYWMRSNENGVRDKSSTVSRSTTSSIRAIKPTPTLRNNNPKTQTPDMNIHMCGLRATDSATSRRGRSRSLENHPDSVTIYSNSREREKGRSFERIVGGTEAEPYSWPWVAALYKVTSNGGNRFLSAGSLINENFVLTAAHVFTPEDLRSASFVVMLGTHTAKEAVAEYPVMSVLRHPKYQQRFYYNDIALLRLVRPVVFNNYVMPVCLPSHLMTDDDIIGKRVTVMGWGDESYGGITSRVLKEASFPIVSRETCNTSYIRVASNRFPKGITSNLLCAGAPDGGKDACQGDSGGPLTSMQGGRYTQVGIVSFGYRCGDKEYPGVYTRVASYLSWIADNAHCSHRDYYDDYYTR